MFHCSGIEAMRSWSHIWGRWSVWGHGRCFLHWERGSKDTVMSQRFKLALFTPTISTMRSNLEQKPQTYDKIIKTVVPAYAHHFLVLKKNKTLILAVNQAQLCRRVFTSPKCVEISGFGYIHDLLDLKNFSMKSTQIYFCTCSCMKQRCAGIWFLAQDVVDKDEHLSVFHNYWKFQLWFWFLITSSGLPNLINFSTAWIN